MADGGLRLTHWTEDLTWSRTQKKTKKNGKRKIQARGTEMPAWDEYFSAPRPYGLHRPCTKSVTRVGLQEETQVGSPGLRAIAPRPWGATHAGPDSNTTVLTSKIGQWFEVHC